MGKREVVGLVAVYKVRPGLEDATREVLTSTVTWALVKVGCLLHILHVDRKNPSEFVFYEIWANQAALDKHWASAEFKLLVTKLEPLLSERASVRLLQQIA